MDKQAADKHAARAGAELDGATLDKAALDRAAAKASWRILPLLGIAYLVAFMDRVNISFAAVQMNADLGFSATVYGIGAGVFFLAYALLEIPSNVIMLRFGPRRWIARIMVSWGLLSAAMMFVQTPMQFYVLRFLIGAAEAGFYPCAIFYLSQWFPADRRGRAISRFYLFGPLASVVMGTLSGWLLALDGLGNLHGWQWLFLVEGLPAVLIGVIVLFFLPDAPATSRWLDDDESAALTIAMAQDRQRMGPPPDHAVLAVMRHRQVQILALLGLLTVSAGMTFSLSTPAILIEATGWSAQRIGYLVSMGGLFGAAMMAVTGWFMDKRGDRFAAINASAIAVATGLVLIALAPSPVLVVGGYFMVAAASWTVSLAAIAVWTDVLQARQLAIGAAAINTVNQIGVFVVPIGFGMMKDATGSYDAGIFVLVGMLILALPVSAILKRSLASRNQLSTDSAIPAAAG